MVTHDEIVKKLMSRPGVAAEVSRIEREEGELLDALLKARQDAGLTQAELATRTDQRDAARSLAKALEQRALAHSLLGAWLYREQRYRLPDEKAVAATN